MYFAFSVCNYKIRKNRIRLRETFMRLEQIFTAFTRDVLNMPTNYKIITQIGLALITSSFTLLFEKHFKLYHCPWIVLNQIPTTLY